MSAPKLRRGACPTLGAPMATGDGLLARLVPATSGIPLDALAGLAGAAARRGNGILEVTKRGSLQIRGLTSASAAALEADVAALSIEPRSGLAVETGPLAGLDPAETTDGTALATAIGRQAAAAGLSARLGPKVSVVVDGGGAVPLAASLADIRLDAVGDGWRLALAGTGATATPLALVPESAAPAVVLALLAAIAARGPAGRARDLLGDPMLGALRAGLAPAPLPVRAQATLPIGPLALEDGRVALRLALPFGQVEAGVLEALARAAAEAGAAEARLSPGGALLVLGPAGFEVALGRAALALGLVTQGGDPRLRVSACAGAPACASGHVETRRLAAALAARLSPGRATAHLSGCAKRCGEPAASVRAVGTGAGRLSVEGVAAAEADAVSAILAALARPRPPNHPGRGP